MGHLNGHIITKKEKMCLPSKIKNTHIGNYLFLASNNIQPARILDSDNKQCQDKYDRL